MRYIKSEETVNLSERKLNSTVGFSKERHLTKRFVGDTKTVENSNYNDDDNC